MVLLAKPLRVVIAGASGLVGAATAARLLEQGYHVVRLVRRVPRDPETELYWNPATGEIDADSLAGADAVIHLGGESIAAGRWTARRKAAIRESRVGSTRLLSQALARLPRSPGVFICASAVGFYGDRGEESLTEDRPAGSGFLPEVCQAWEEATEPARQAGLRVVNLRIGIVLSLHGGALARMLTPFRLGLGGVVGNGRQYMSWITLTDLARVIEFVLTNESSAGAVNGVAPNPVTNREFTRTLGRVLGRPTRLPLPGFAVRALFGEMGRTLLLEGCRVQPARLEQAGFAFLHRDLAPALHHLLNAGAPQ